MILDYNYNKKKREFELSYINSAGGKSFIVENIDNMPSYKFDSQGPLIDAWGRKAAFCYTKSPSKFDLKNHILSFDEGKKARISSRTLPKLYTADIEVEVKFDLNGHPIYSEASDAAHEILTISLCSSELNTLVLGTRPLREGEDDWCNEQFKNYIENVKFFKELNMPTPYFKYVYFKNEREMLEYFLKFVAKVPILSGWNFIKFDWQYIVNRIKKYYPDLNLSLSSARSNMTNKKFKDKYGNELMLPIPDHTYIIDMMEVIEEDKVVLPIKESYQLDYIAEASMGINKIEYENTLQHLYNSNYKKYVYYNAIDSILVQLIDKKFGILKNLYTQALIAVEAITGCFSKIKLTEALFYKYFYENHYPVVYERKDTPERSGLLGAYVKIPSPGKYSFPVCNDFASLYPSTIITCNLSIENYIGSYWNEATLNSYRADVANYIVIGPNVFKNDGTMKRPKLGNFVGKFLNDAALEPFKQDIKNYFVSVNGCVYKNDKDYAFKQIQKNLKSERAINKYLSKQLDALVVYDIDHIMKGGDFEGHEYNEQISKTISLLAMEGIDNIKSYKDLQKLSLEDLTLLKTLLKEDITFKVANEQAIKLLMNSMYGGSSHVSFYWYNMNLANDITGEARNLTLLMEKHLSSFWTDNWYKMADLHQKLGIKLKPEYLKAMETRDLQKNNA